ncbi:glutaminase A [Clostridiaceae bacterium 35-E11]
MNDILQSVICSNRCWTSKGKVATYIPELSKGNPDALGIYVITCNGEEYSFGDFETKFTIQSISKVVTLMCVLHDYGKEKVFQKVSVEPTSDAFNSIINLEAKNFHKPLNPMINAGAIATVSMLNGNTPKEKFCRVLKFMRELAGNANIDLNENVYLSEKITGHRNRALAHFMKSTNIMDGNVEDILDVYFKLCSIEITCKDIAKIGAVLANNGVLPWNKKRLIAKETAKIVKAIMTTCGMYDASGEFSVSVGIPAKSGVGGGILAVVPNRMGIGVIGPSLDQKGNSIAGIKVLEELNKKLNLSIF